jgi:hypothetical protein
MDMQQLTQLFLYSTLLNYSILVFWLLIISTAKDFVMRIHGCWFDLSKEGFDTIHYTLMGQFKLLIFIFNLSPFIVLTLLF